MRSDPIDSSVALPGGGRVAAWTFLRVRFGLVCGLAGHSEEKRYHIGFTRDGSVAVSLGFSRKRDQPSELGTPHVSKSAKPGAPSEFWEPFRLRQGLRP